MLPNESFKKFDGIGLPFNQATALDQKLAVLVFDFEALVLFRFARQSFMKCDAAKERTAVMLNAKTMAMAEHK